MALFQGILTGKYSTIDSIPPWQRRTRHFNANKTNLATMEKKGLKKRCAPIFMRFNK